MSSTPDFTKYDQVLSSILVNEKSILGFLSAIFNFLARRTDFYHVPEGPYENMGFPPGVAEELVIKVLRTCDPKNWKGPNGASRPADISNEIMCSTVAQEVEVIAEEDKEEFEEQETETAVIDTKEQINYPDISKLKVESQDIPKEGSNTSAISKGAIPKTEAEKTVKEAAKVIPDDYQPPVIPTQNSETYNGAERDIYLWSQTIMELEATVKLPPDIKSSKDLKVTINPNDITIAKRNGDIILKDSLPYKIKVMDSFWSISEKKLVIHLEKVQERWWDRLLNNEEPIDLSKIDCSRPLTDLPEDHVAKVRELQWNQERKMQGLPTSDEIRNIDILKKAWNAPGSPFQGQKFDPNILNSTAPLPSYSGDQ
ncbi:nudC domain-containing protein 3 [Anticarsia gemmatalis]|uniref:nudC domain-containing protein 3 n=1 Tax=Anticarsia gemmatalis TaxID=129554 RepID=UPI003F75843D